jgi:hypothetical protein
VTVRDWISGHTPNPPQALEAQLFAALAGNEQRDASHTTDICLAAAVRSLQALLAARRFGRDAALDLLAIDALTTYAYEYAATSGTMLELESAADSGARLLANLTVARV